MAKAIWKQKREEIQEKIAKAVKECYAIKKKSGQDSGYCACCPLGLECKENEQIEKCFSEIEE